MWMYNDTANPQSGGFWLKVDRIRINKGSV